MKKIIAKVVFTGAGFTFSPVLRNRAFINQAPAFNCICHPSMGQNWHKGHGLIVVIVPPSFGDSYRACGRGSFGRVVVWEQWLGQWF